MNEPLTIALALERIAARELSAEELVQACLARIARLDAAIHAFITVTAPTSPPPPGPLAGIPIGIKDVFATAGVRTTAHSRQLIDHVPTASAASVGRLLAAGAVSLGKLATHEFALGGPSFDLPWPPARNPWDTTRFTGGSSSGAAAALAAGLVLGALGSDTTGSIRSPAALCGVTGLKPTFGRISTRGVTPLAASLDTVGPMARTAEDCALLLQAIADPDVHDVPDYRKALARGVQGLRIGVVRHFHERDQPAKDSAIAAIDEAVRVLVAAGANVRAIELPPLAQWHAAGTLILLAEAHAVHARRLREAPERFGAILRNRLRAGALIAASDYVQAQRKRRELNAALEPVMRDIDLLMTAVQPGEAPRIDVMPEWGIVEVPSYNMPFSLAGIPAISLPCGFGPRGLPLGFQLAARAFDEPTLLAAAHAFQCRTDWHAHVPTLAASADHAPAGSDR